MKKNYYRPGSEAEAQAKLERKWFAVYSIVLAAIFLLFVLPVPTFFHHYYTHAEGVLKGIGWLLFVALQVFAWYAYPKYKDSWDWLTGGWAAVITLGGAGVMSLFLGGFNFSLFGL